MRGDYVVVGQPVHEQQRAAQRRCLPDQGAAVIGLRVLVRVTEVALAPVRVVQPLVGGRRSRTGPRSPCARTDGERTVGGTCRPPPWPTAAPPYGPTSAGSGRPAGRYQDG